MANIESDPEYKNRHPKAIHLDSYRGVACDLMELNKPVADRFMQVSDMRSDVVVMQKPQDRVRDYDEIGFVRVAKFLKMPRLDLWHNGNGLLQTRKEDGVWYIAINDQDLADQVARTEGDNRKFDERFVDAFKAEVRRGLTTCLKREKLLNGGEYNLGFFIGYFGLLRYDLIAGLEMLAVSALTRDAVFAAEAVGIIAGINIVWNGLNLFSAGIIWSTQRMSQKMFGSNLTIKPINLEFHDPFVKHSVVDFIMPPVPVDRLLRGLNYLNQHGSELINTQYTTKQS